MPVMNSRVIVEEIVDKEIRICTYHYYRGAIYKATVANYGYKGIDVELVKGDYDGWSNKLSTYKMKDNSKSLKLTIRRHRRWVKRAEEQAIKSKAKLEQLLKWRDELHKKDLLDEKKLVLERKLKELEGDDENER